MGALLALATTLMTFAVVWLTQDWFNALLNELPLTHGGPASAAEMLVTLAMWPFILLFNLLAIPGVLVAAAFKPLCD